MANGYNVSRTHAKELVERGMVRVNWTEIDRPDFMLAVNDLISVRRFGRMKLLAENGITKKINGASHWPSLRNRLENDHGIDPTRDSR